MGNKKKILSIKNAQTFSFVDNFDKMATIIGIVPSAVREGTSQVEIGLEFRHLTQILSTLGDITEANPDSDQVWLNELIMHIAANITYIPLGLEDVAEIESIFEAGDDEFSIGIIYELRDFTKEEDELMNLVAMQKVLQSEDLFQRIVETDDN